MRLYFVRYDHRGGCIWGGHFLAEDAAGARAAAATAFARDRATALAHNLRVGPPASACIAWARPSTANISNAMNRKGDAT